MTFNDFLKVCLIAVLLSEFITACSILSVDEHCRTWQCFLFYTFEYEGIGIVLLLLAMLGLEKKHIKK